MRGQGLSPRAWPIWLGLGGMRALSLLPFGVQLHLCAALGTAARLVARSHVRVARQNLALCLPELSGPQREAILRRHFHSLGRVVAETAAAWWMPTARLRDQAVIEGLEHLDAVQASGHGAILLAAHFTTLELAVRILAACRPIHVVYKPTRNAVLTDFIRRQRAAASAGALSRDDIGAIARALRSGAAVWYAPDQAYRNKGAAMVPFFGVPAATNTATTRLARITGARVLPFFAERRTGAPRYRVILHPPLENFPSADPAADAARFHELIEAQVRRVPEQYLWVHRRFKGLSADYPDPYA